MASEAIRNVYFDDVRSKGVLVALSGGMDSVALLALICRERDSIRVTAAHFHHGIRGAEADADAAFCRDLCRRMNVPLIEGRADVPALAREKSIGLESAAREARYDFLRDAREQCGADFIALAHHMDDQAETILMHLLRGAGSDGLRGMERVSGPLYRPLLEIPKARLRQFLEENGISWREDATNGVSDNPRNALRLNVLPEIEKSYPSAASAIARYGKIARVEGAFLDRLTESFLKERLQRGPYGRRLLLDGSEEEALLRRSLRKIAGASLSAEKIEALSQLARKKRGKLEVSGALFAEKTPCALYFLPKTAVQSPAVKLSIPGETVLKGVCRIVAEPGSFPMEVDNPSSELFDADQLRDAVVRTRRNGDRIHPLGAPGEKLLSDYFTDRKLDRPLRDWTPLVAVKDRIVWACGLGMGNDARVSKETLRTVRLKIYSITDEEPEVRL